MINKLQLALLLSLTSIPVYTAGANKKPIEYEVKSFKYDDKKQQGKILFQDSWFWFIPKYKKSSNYFIPHSIETIHNGMNDLNDNNTKSKASGKNNQSIVLYVTHFGTRNKASRSMERMGEKTVTFLLKKKNKRDEFMHKIRELIQVSNYNKDNDGDDDLDESNIKVTNLQTDSLNSTNKNDADLQDPVIESKAKQLSNDNEAKTEAYKIKLEKAQEENKKLQQKTNSLQTQIKENQDTTNGKLKNLLVTQLKVEVKNNKNTQELINLLSNKVSSLSQKADNFEVNMKNLSVAKKELEKVTKNKNELNEKINQYEKGISEFIEKNKKDITANDENTQKNAEELIDNLKSIKIPAENNAKHSHSFVIFSLFLALIIGSFITIGVTYLIDFLRKKSGDLGESEPMNKNEDTEDYYI